MSRTPPHRATEPLFTRVSETIVCDNLAFQREEPSPDRELHAGLGSFGKLWLKNRGRITFGPMVTQECDPSSLAYALIRVDGVDVGTIARESLHVADGCARLVFYYNLELYGSVSTRGLALDVAHEELFEVERDWRGAIREGSETARQVLARVKHVARRHLVLALIP